MLLYIPILVLCVHSTFSQVGIGTVAPTAELEIETTNTGIPALELNPQTGPTGTVTGQIAVIGDKLFMYDDTRNKWLSVETMPLQYGRNGNADNQRLHYGGNMQNNNSGAMMPFNGTVVAVSSRSSGGQSDKQFQVRIRNGTTNQSGTFTFDLVSNEYISTTTDANFNSGDYINVHAQAAGSTVSNATVILWIKWRQ